MPGGDRTGPAGLGPMTGRGAGYCAGYPVPGYMNPVPGGGRWYGFGRGRGGGRGWGRGFGRGFAGYWYANPYPNPFYPAGVAPKQEAEMLKEQARAMREEIEAIDERIKELESGSRAGDNE
jgi:hypothetical protein